MTWRRLPFFYTDHIEVPLPPGHRFPMEKYRLLHEKLIQEQVLHSDQLFPAPEATVPDLLLAHDASYIQGLLDNTLSEKVLRPIGLTWSRELLMRSLCAVGGFVEVSEAALTYGFSSLLAGGTHHAHADRGEGYCVLNDFAVAALRLLKLGKVKKILIIDLDVHQGNGNSSIMGHREDVFILSLHGEKNYPFKKIPSHMDVPLPTGTGDEAYLDALRIALDKVPKDFDMIFYQAGVDNLKEDTLGTFQLSLEGLMRRDRLVFEFAKSFSAPVAMAIGGGYAKPISLTVQAHLNTFRVARECINQE